MSDRSPGHNLITGSPGFASFTEDVGLIESIFSRERTGKQPDSSSEVVGPTIIWAPSETRFSAAVAALSEVPPVNSVLIITVVVLFSFL